jgi:hypothetical protein
VLSFLGGAFKEVSPGHFSKPDKPKKKSAKEIESLILGGQYKPHHS